MPGDQLHRERDTYRWLPDTPGPFVGQQPGS